MKEHVKKGMSTGKKVAIGAGVVAASVATAGAYYLLGPNSKEHQKKAFALLAKMKKEIADEIEKVEEVTVPIYHKAVDFVAENYAKQYEMHEEDIRTFAEKLKNEWKGAKKVVKKAVREAKKNI